MPRWIGNILGVTGSRKSEELNFSYFTKGKHTPMAILVNNGLLTQSSVDNITKYAKSVEGIENAYGWLILEATGLDEDDDIELEDSKAAKTSIKLQSLTDTLQQDALFQDYDEKSRTKIRAAFRLPPIYTGESKDYTRATADTARGIAEEQVFNPERIKLANRLNRLINSTLDITHAALKFRGPNLTNKIELAGAIDIYRKAGALTPNMLVQLVSELLGQDFEPFDQTWGNLPVDLTIEKMRMGSDPTVEGNKDPDPDPEGSIIDE